MGFKADQAWRPSFPATECLLHFALLCFPEQGRASPSSICKHKTFPSILAVVTGHIPHHGTIQLSEMLSPLPTTASPWESTLLPVSMSETNIHRLFPPFFPARCWQLLFHSLPALEMPGTVMGSSCKLFNWKEFLSGLEMSGGWRRCVSVKRGLIYSATGSVWITENPSHSLAAAGFSMGAVN